MNMQTKDATAGAVPASNILASRAMLASLTITQWHGTKLDRRVTDSATAAHNASADAGRFNKRAIRKEAFAKIQAITTRARIEHDSRTLPWGKGAQLLAAPGFLDWNHKMRDLKAEFDAAAAEFVAAYPGEIEAAKKSLGDMFDPADYPSPDEIAGRFSFSFRILPFPDARDFRVDLGDAHVAAIRAEIEADGRRALAEATAEPFKRIALTVGAMAEKLAAFKPATRKGEKSEGVFRDSLVENVRELTALLPALNVTGDSTLAEIAERMKAELCRHDAEALRKSDNLRAATAAKAEKIVQDISAFLA